MHWWTLLGLITLLSSLGLFVFTARRSARAESRGDELARLLLRESLQLAPIDWNSESQRSHLLSRLVAAAVAEGVALTEFAERPSDDTPGFSFFNKHYVVAIRPSTERNLDAAAGDADLPLEVVAWPRTTIGPAKSVFFHPEDADRAHCRNLAHGYCDESAQTRPEPGMFHRRSDAAYRPWDYRSWDDERFLVGLRPRS